MSGAAPHRRAVRQTMEQRAVLAHSQPMLDLAPETPSALGGTGSSGSIPGLQGFHLSNNNGEQNGGWSLFGTAGRFFNCGGAMLSYANANGFGSGGASTLCPMSGSGAPGFVFVEW